MNSTPSSVFNLPKYLLLLKHMWTPFSSQRYHSSIPFIFKLKLIFEREKHNNSPSFNIPFWKKDRNLSPWKTCVCYRNKKNTLLFTFWWKLTKLSMNSNIYVDLVFSLIFSPIQNFLYPCIKRYTKMSVA